MLVIFFLAPFADMLIQLLFQAKRTYYRISSTNKIGSKLQLVFLDRQFHHRVCSVNKITPMLSTQSLTQSTSASTSTSNSLVPAPASSKHISSSSSPVEEYAAASSMHQPASSSQSSTQLTGSPSYAASIPMATFPTLTSSNLATSILFTPAMASSTADMASNSIQ